MKIKNKKGYPFLPLDLDSKWNDEHVNIQLISFLLFYVQINNGFLNSQSENSIINLKPIINNLILLYFK